MAPVNRRLRPDILAMDHHALNAIGQFVGYAPRNAALSAASLQALAQAAAQAQQAEQHAEAALAAARDAARAAEWALHDAILDAKVEVQAQYGTSSNEVQAMGLKKRSERTGRPSVPRSSGLT